MKNLLIIISAAILLTSCGGSSFLNRKYTKGVYSEGISKATKPLSRDINHDKTVTKKITPAVVLDNSIYSNAATQSKETNFYTENTLSHKKNITKKQTSAKATTSYKAKILVLPGSKSTADKKTTNNKSQGSSRDSNFIIMVILCFFPFINLIPVYMHDSKQVTLNFWITLLLCFTLLGGVVFALLVVLDIIDLA